MLVGENYVLKVADFGLARDIYKDEHYVKTTAVRMITTSLFVINNFVVERFLTECRKFFRYCLVMHCDAL